MLWSYAINLIQWIIKWSLWKASTGGSDWGLWVRYIQSFLVCKKLYTKEFDRTLGRNGDTFPNITTVCCIIYRVHLKVGHSTRKFKPFYLVNYKESSAVYLRPVRGCIKVGCVLAALAGCCLGLLTLVLLLANSSLMVCGMSGSNLTPCCKIAHKKRVILVNLYYLYLQGLIFKV